MIPKIGTGIETGVSLNGLLCGSVLSVAITIGIKYGRTSPEENPNPSRIIWSISTWLSLGRGSAISTIDN